MNEKLVANDSGLLITYMISHQGQVLEASAEGAPVEYQMGTGQWPVQLELAMLGEAPGAQLNVTIQAGDNAFGQADPARIVSMDAVDFKIEPEPGELIEFNLENEETVEGHILSVFADKIEVDFNHPYSGRDLNIQIQIVSIL